MKRVLTVGLALLIVSLAGLGVVGSVFAQEPEGVLVPGEGLRWGLMGSWGRIRAGGGIASEVIADLMGLTIEEIHEARVEGQTLSEIANAQGVTDDELVEAIVAGRAEAIEQAVADGTLTQEQADWLIAKAEAMGPFMLTNPFAPGGPRGLQSMRGSGGFRGGPRGGFGGECPRLAP